MRFIRYSIVVGLTILSLTGCTETAEETDPPTTVVVPVKIALLQRGDIAVGVSALGQTEALDKETIISPVAGILTKLAVSEGSTISAGDSLASIETKESQTAIAGARALMAAAVTQAQRDEAALALKLAESHAQTVYVTAHRNGIVTGRQVAVGSQVSEGSELFSIVDPASIGFVAQVPVGDLPAVAIGQPATVYLSRLDSMEFRAAVAAFSPESDPQSQTVRVRLRLVDVEPQQSRVLRDGMLGRARIVTGHHTGVFLAPRTALLRNDETDQYTLVTITPDSLAQVIPVTTGVMNDSEAEITGPDLRADMPVVIEGQYALADSTHVTVSPQDAP